MTPDARSLAPLVLFTLTSLGAYAAGVGVGGLRRSALRAATWDMLGALGLGVVFLLCNLAVGTVLALGVRGMTHHFVSIYVLSDVTVPILSLVQALVFRCWRERSR